MGPEPSRATSRDLCRLLTRGAGNKTPRKPLDTGQLNTAHTAQRKAGAGLAEGPQVPCTGPQAERRGRLPSIPPTGS